MYISVSSDPTHRLLSSSKQELSPPPHGIFLFFFFLKCAWVLLLTECLVRLEGSMVLLSGQVKQTPLVLPPSVPLWL